MEHIFEFYKDLKDRLSSPFFSSFILAWLVFNYKIVIVLLFYTNSEIIKEGHGNLLSFIEGNRCSKNIFWWPLTSAFGYTFLFPFLRTAILAFNAWIKASGTNIILKITNEAKIPMSSYRYLQKKLNDRIKDAEEAYKAEDLARSENIRLKQDLSNLNTDKDEAIQKAGILSNLSNPESYAGQWQISYMTLGEPQMVFIGQGIIQINEDAIQPSHIMSILFIGVENAAEYINFVFKSGGAIDYWRLKYDGKIDDFNGEDSKSVQFNLKRVY
jgi:hypothetical protein